MADLVLKTKKLAPSDRRTQANERLEAWDNVPRPSIHRQTERSRKSNIKKCVWSLKNTLLAAAILTLTMVVGSAAGPKKRTLDQPLPTATWVTHQICVDWDEIVAPAGFTTEFYMVEVEVTFSGIIKQTNEAGECVEVPYSENVEVEHRVVNVNSDDAIVEGGCDCVSLSEFLAQAIDKLR